MKLILPKTYIDWGEITPPFFFFMGPIRGGDDWQKEMFLALGRHLPEFTAAIPCRWEEGHPLFRYRLTGKVDSGRSQTIWERYYIRFADECSTRGNGMRIIWLPEESKVNPRKEGPYAQDTYGELGALRIQKAQNPQLTFVIGAQPGFPGLRTFRTNLLEDIGATDFPIYSSLKETAQKAAELVKKNKPY